MGTRKLQEMPDNFLDEPPPSPEVEELAGNLQYTFGFPAGHPLSEPALFDIRDDVCQAVGGFCHGQVVVDEDDDKAVVVGVKESKGRLRLWFKPEGRQGAGLFPKYHLVRKSLKVVGKQKLEQVDPSDPMYKKGPVKGNMMELLEALLTHAKGDEDGQKDQASSLPSDFVFDYSFRYLQKSCEPGLFDIRDEVCMAVGGYRHGDVVSHLGGEHESVVIGVRPDNEGEPKLWMHSEGELGAGIFQEMGLLRMTSEVVRRQSVAEFEDEEQQGFSPEFVAGLECTFNYPEGVRGRTRRGLFDIRDEVCLGVGGFKHGDRVKLGKMELVVIGVSPEKGVPTMHFQMVKPKTRIGAGTFSNFHLLKRRMKFLRSETVEEVLLDESDPSGLSPTMCESSESSDPNLLSDGDSEMKSPRSQASQTSDASHVTAKEEGSGKALVLSLSHCTTFVRDILLNSEELADCRASDEFVAVFRVRSVGLFLLQSKV